MEIDSHAAFVNALPAILTAIQEAQFVSLDLEFGGIALHSHSNGSLPSLEERYTSIRDAAEQFPVIQFGITTTRWKASTQQFELKPFNITLDLTAPYTLGFDRTFAFSSDAVRFLNKSRFKFATGFGNGVGYLSHHEEKMALEAPIRAAVNDIPIATTKEEQKDVDEFCEYVNDKLDLLDTPEISSVALYPSGADLRNSPNANAQSTPLFSMFQKSLVRKCVEERERGWRVIMGQDLIHIRKDSSYHAKPPPSDGSQHRPTGTTTQAYDKGKWQADRQRRIIREREDMVPYQAGLRWVFDFMVGKSSASEIRQALKIDRPSEYDNGRKNRMNPRQTASDEDQPYANLLSSIKMLRAEVPNEASSELQEALNLTISHIQDKQAQALEDQIDNPDPSNAKDTKSKWNCIPSPDRTRKSVLVGHNNFVDLMYLYKAFVGPLPETLMEFANEMHQLFPVIVDTKYFRVKNARILDANLPLEHLVSAADAKVEPVAEIPSGFNDYAITSSIEGPAQGQQHHQAGYDSWLTALYLVRLYASRVKGGKITSKDLMTKTVNKNSQFRNRGALPKEFLYSMLFDFGLGSTGNSGSPNRSCYKAPPLWEDDINQFCVLATEDRVWNLMNCIDDEMDGER